MSEPTPGDATGAIAADDADLVAWLRDRDVPCPLCGYNLRRLAMPRCPECGQPLRLGVSLAEPYLKAWVATAAAVLLPAGMGVLWLFMIPRRGFPRGSESVANVPVIYQVLAVPLSAVVVVGRRRFQRWPRLAQRFAAVAATSLAVASFVLLCYAFA